MASFKDQYKKRSLNSCSLEMSRLLRAEARMKEWKQIRSDLHLQNRGLCVNSVESNYAEKDDENCGKGAKDQIIEGNAPSAIVVEHKRTNCVKIGKLKPPEGKLVMMTSGSKVPQHVPNTRKEQLEKWRKEKEMKKKLEEKNKPKPFKVAPFQPLKQIENTALSSKITSAPEATGSKAPRESLRASSTKVGVSTLGTKPKFHGSSSGFAIPKAAASSLKSTRSSKAGNNPSGSRVLASKLPQPKTNMVLRSSAKDPSDKNIGNTNLVKNVTARHRNTVASRATAAVKLQKSKPTRATAECEPLLVNVGESVVETAEDEAEQEGGLSPAALKNKIKPRPSLLYTPLPKNCKNVRLLAAQEPAGDLMCFSPINNKE